VLTFFRGFTLLADLPSSFFSLEFLKIVWLSHGRPGLWHRAKKMVLSAGQTEVKIDFPLPIVACNLMIEYADFYDNVQASAETLQCPRCSASVPANPGVCGNCGENVFQCHKCRYSVLMLTMYFDLTSSVTAIIMFSHFIEQCGCIYIASNSCYILNLRTLYCIMHFSAGKIVA